MPPRIIDEIRLRYFKQLVKVCLCTRQNRVDSIDSVATASLKRTPCADCIRLEAFTSSLIRPEIFVFTELVSQSFRAYCSFAYSALASFRMGMSGSAVPLSSSLLPTADTRWLLRRSQQDQDCTDASKHSRSDQQTLALVWKVNCHDRHDGGMSNIQPGGEDGHRAIH